MVQQGLAPGMPDRQKADLGPEVFRVSRNRAQGLGGGAEQDVVGDALVLVRNRGNLLWDGKDNMKILRLQQFRPPLLQPLGAGQRLTFGTVSVTT